MNNPKIKIKKTIYNNIKRNKILGKKFNNRIQNLQSENSKILLEEMKEHLDKWIYSSVYMSIPIKMQILKWQNFKSERHIGA